MRSRLSANLGAVLMALLFGAIFVFPAAFRPAQVHAQTAPSDDPALLRELAERLLSFYRGDNEVEAQLFPGALPPGLPLDLSLPPDSRLIGSAILPQPGPPGQIATNMVIVADTATAPADVLAFYQSLLTNTGWTPAPQSGFRPGGFLPSAAPIGFANYCQSANGPSLNISVQARTGEPNDLRLQLTTASPGPCNPQSQPGPPPPFAQLLPALGPPPGVTITANGGFGGGPESQQANAVALTDMDVAELESFYAQQLIAAGWTRTDGAAQGALAWSVWSVPGDKTRQGFLSVLAGPGAKERTLELRVTTPGASNGGFGVVGVVAPGPPPPPAR